jgi:hypothetical protein
VEGMGKKYGRKGGIRYDGKDKVMGKIWRKEIKVRKG